MTHFLSVQYVIKQLGCVICNSALSLKDICQNIKESPYFEETTWLAMMKHFLSVQYVIEQLGSVKFIILPHLSKI